MKRIQRVVLFTFFAGLVSSVYFTSARGQNPSRVRALAARRDAETNARRFWFERLIQCGQDYFTRVRENIYQFRNIHIQLTSLDVSGSDRLNGVQWRGRTSLNAAESRVYSGRRGVQIEAGWGRWTQGLPGGMGAVGLTAEVRKEKGRWVVIPNSISPASSFTSVTCAEAADPAAANKRSEANKLGAAIQNYKANAARMGIYAHNISDEIWKALYLVGYPGGNVGHTTVSWVFLGANGGWGACGRNGCRNSFGIKFPDGHWSVEQITQGGGYVLIDLASDKYGHNRRNFADYNVPAALIAQIKDYLGRGLTIKRVRVGYSGEWFVHAAGVHACLGCPPKDEWTWGNTSQSADKTFRFLKGLHNNADWAKRPTIRDVAFLPRGGHVIIFSKSDYYADGAPAAAVETLKKLRDSGQEINQVTFGPNDSWIIRANGWW